MSRVATINQAPYIACETMDLIWEMTDVLDVVTMWQHGKPIQDISEYIGRDIDETAILIMDLARSRKIGPREGGVFGGVK